MGQYTGTADRVESAQVAVDHALYLPESWTQIRPGATARVPAGTALATKPALAAAMIGHREVGPVLAVGMSPGSCPFRISGSASPLRRARTR